MHASLEEVIATARGILASTGWDMTELAGAIHIEDSLEGYYVVAGNRDVW